MVPAKLTVCVAVVAETPHLHSGVIRRSYGALLLNGVQTHCGSNRRPVDV